MQPEVANILAEARAQIARGDEPDVQALEERIRAVDEAALVQLRRLLAVHRAKRSLAAPTAPKPSQPARPRREIYRAKPTIAANMAVRARAAGDGVVLEWDAVKGVARWEARVSERLDARSQYTEGETLTLDAPQLDLQLNDLPKRVSVVGRNAAGRIVQRALVSGLTSANWDQRWQQRASAS